MKSTFSNLNGIIVDRSITGVRGKIRMEKKSIFCIWAALLAAGLLQAPLFSADGELLGKIGSVNQSTGEIIVQSPNAGQKIFMGSRLYVRIGGRVVIMTATFPMQTVAKCRLIPGNGQYLKKLDRGLPVYLYVPDVEKAPILETDREIKEYYQKLEEVTLDDGTMLVGVIYWQDRTNVKMNTAAGVVTIPIRGIAGVKMK